MTNEMEKEFLEVFKSLCGTRNSWQVWSDVISVMAIALANAVEVNPDRKATREKEFDECIQRLGGNEKPAKLLAIVTTAFEKNPQQDFLGGLFMKLNLGSHWKGQFFTPYHVCEFMSEVTMTDLTSDIDRKGYVTVNDCACGAGAILIAAANTMASKKVNYQNHALFVAQDVDRLVGMMCYIQLSLLGCAGYVVIADSITNPIVGNTLFPREQEKQEFWYTPMFYSQVWNYRRMFKEIDRLCGGDGK